MFKNIDIKLKKNISRRSCVCKTFCGGNVTKSP